MQMGCLTSLGGSNLNNLLHIVIDNGVHESTGSQPTLSDTLDWINLFKANGYKSVSRIENLNNISSLDIFTSEGPCALIFSSCPGSRKDLGRPTVTPKENKTSFMGIIGP